MPATKHAHAYTLSIFDPLPSMQIGREGPTYLATYLGRRSALDTQGACTRAHADTLRPADSCLSSPLRSSSPLRTIVRFSLNDCANITGSCPT
jgi:hypothetical protein